MSVLVFATIALAGLGGPQSPASEQGTGFIGSYFVNGEIHVNEYGTLEGKPLTSGLPQDVCRCNGG